jgi:hypothetical protein
MNSKKKKMNTKKRLAGFLMLLLPVTGYCQQEADTAALILEYNKVMSFTAQPYMHYTTVTKLGASPVLQSQDTASLMGEFFKNGTDIYSNNVKEEVYLQDSLMVSISNDRKTIWLNRVDVSTKDRMNVINPFGKEVQEIMRRNYTISKFSPDDRTSQLVFETRKPGGNAATRHTRITVEYDNKLLLPRKIDIEISIKEPVNEEDIAALKEEEVDEKQLLQEINGSQYLVRKQSMHIQFTSINNDKETVIQMPWYKSCLDYNEVTQEFTGKGKYKDYEVTRLF